MSARLSVRATKIDLVQQADADFKKNARRALTQSSQVLLRYTQFYVRRQRGPNPSAPGEPPAMQTGKLAKSFKRLRTRLRKGYGSAGITSSEPYSYMLEYGTTVVAHKIGNKKLRGRANRLLRGFGRVLGNAVYRVAPRPYLKPAQDDAEPEVTRILTEVIQ